MLETTLSLLSGPAGLVTSVALLATLVTIEFGQALDHPRARLAVRLLWAFSMPLLLAFVAVVAVGLAEGGR
jgi:hypothetical protein